MDDDARGKGNDDWRLAGESLRDIAEKGYSCAELEAVIGAQKSYNATLPGDREIHRRIGKLNKSQLKDYARRLADRLSYETTVLDGLATENLDPFAADLRDVPIPFPVEYVSAEIIRDMHPHVKNSNACYRGGKIYIGSELPALRERLTTFATRGILANDLFHEVFHGFQDTEIRFDSLEAVLDYIANPFPAEWQTALAETHAWVTCLPGFKDEVLMPVILESYAIRGKHFLEAAFDAVRTLHALELTDREIGKLISEAHWDDAARGYTTLVSEIDRLAQRHGHSATEIGSIVERHKLIQRLQVLRGMAIAAEECQSN